MPNINTNRVLPDILAKNELFSFIWQSVIFLKPRTVYLLLVYFCICLRVYYHLCVYVYMHR